MFTQYTDVLECILEVHGPYMSAFVLTFTQNDLTLVEIYTVVLHFGLDTCQIKLGFVQVNGKC